MQGAGHDIGKLSKVTIRNSNSSSDVESDSQYRGAGRNNLSWKTYKILLHEEGVTGGMSVLLPHPCVEAIPVRVVIGDGAFGR